MPGRMSAAALLLAALFAGSPSRAVTLYEKGEFKLLLSGHLQDLTQSTEDPFFREHISDNTVRSRNRLRMLTGSPLSAELTVDATYTFGSVLDSTMFSIAREIEPPTYFDWSCQYASGEDGRYGTVSIYRALATLEGERVRVVLGRQRLAYGTALFWSPVDIWNPVSPLALEPENRIGVDGASATWWATDHLTFTALYGVGDTWDESRAAVSGSYSYKSYTVDLLAGKRFQDEVIGADFVGYLGDAAIHGEFTWTAAEDGDDFGRAVLGGDYAFPGSLYVAAEYYYNGGPLEVEEFTLAGVEEFFQATGVDTIQRNFAGATASYDLTPLLAASATGILDLDKGSWAAAPAFMWSASAYLTVNGGAQFFGGAKDGEYGSVPDLVWVRIRLDY